MLRFLGVFAAFLLSFAAHAEQAKLTSLDTMDATRGWQGVGRVNIGERGFCTGTLISPSIVLTAAHCFFDKKTGEALGAGNVEFLAGLSQGRVAAQRDARRVILHPDYIFMGDGSMDYVHADLALIELDHPIQTSAVIPFETTSYSHIGQKLAVVSYAKDREDAPSLQRNCEVLVQQEGVDVTSCDVDFGSSGAPVFVERGGRLMVTSVVSAKGEWNAQKVAIAAGVEQGLDVLMAELNGAGGKFRSASAAQNLIKSNGTKDTVGALFLRP